jgi:hypothetical protein
LVLECALAVYISSLTPLVGGDVLLLIVFQPSPTYRGINLARLVWTSIHLRGYLTENASDCVALWAFSPQEVEQTLGAAYLFLVQKYVNTFVISLVSLRVLLNNGF